jgi:hypothetical protein
MDKQKPTQALVYGQAKTLHKIWQYELYFGDFIYWNEVTNDTILE